jgi:hypothetical protein
MIYLSDMSIHSLQIDSMLGMNGGPIFEIAGKMCDRHGIVSAK